MDLEFSLSPRDDPPPNFSVFFITIQIFAHLFFIVCFLHLSIAAALSSRLDPTLWRPSTGVRARVVPPLSMSLARGATSRRRGTRNPESVAPVLNRDPKHEGWLKIKQLRFTLTSGRTEAHGKLDGELLSTPEGGGSASQAKQSRGSNSPSFFQQWFGCHTLDPPGATLKGPTVVRSRLLAAEAGCHNASPPLVSVPNAECRGSTINP